MKYSDDTKEKILDAAFPPMAEERIRELLERADKLAYAAWQAAKSDSKTEKLAESVRTLITVVQALSQRKT